MINVNVNVQNQLIGVLVKQVKCGILVHMIQSMIKRVKLVEYLKVKNSACKEQVIDSLVLACEDEI